MRTLVGALADVHPYPAGWQSLNGVVQRRDPEFLELPVRRHVQARVEPEAVRQVRVVELKDEARIGDGSVLLVQGVCQCEKKCFVAGVIPGRGYARRLRSEWGRVHTVRPLGLSSYSTSPAWMPPSQVALPKAIRPRGTPEALSYYILRGQSSTSASHTAPLFVASLRVLTRLEVVPGSAGWATGWVRTVGGKGCLIFLYSQRRTDS